MDSGMKFRENVQEFKLVGKGIENFWLLLQAIICVLQALKCLWVTCL